MARALEYTPATAQSQDYTPTTAQSWEYSQQAISSYTSEPIQSYAVSQARNAGINGKLILAILWTESRNCSITEGPTNDMGCFQISPHYAKAKGLNPAKLKTNSRYNTDAAIELLKYLKLRYGRKEPKTWFCRYNVGTGPMTGNKAKNCIKYLNALHYKTN
jgi:soluble lytic murein transglycosylase-like protein